MSEGLQLPIGNGRIQLRQGDICTLEVDAIVNAANTALQLGAGVAGAIRIAGGPTIQRECDLIGHCPVGGAVATGAGVLAAKNVIHAVGPVWVNQTDSESDRLLTSAASEALARARELELTSIALPSISTGVFGFPLERAAGLLLETAIAHLESGKPPTTVIFCLFDEKSLAVFEDALAELR